MAYDHAVCFTVTDTYGCGPEDEDDVYTKSGFGEFVESGAFVDYDGYGYPVKDGKSDQSIVISPSKWPRCMPDDATHVIWFNR